MREYVDKADVIEMLESLPRDIVFDHIFDLKGIWLDDAYVQERKTVPWIPCSERLPEEMGTYLVTLEYKEHGTGITTLWFHGPSIGWDLRVADVVTAWMPLPEPYREEGD